MAEANEMTRAEPERLPECDAFRKLESVCSIDPRYAARALPSRK